MAEKRKINPVLFIVVGVLVIGLMAVLLQGNQEAYRPITQLPQHQLESKPKDGDTQADTIKALQAYSKEAIERAKSLNDDTRDQAAQVTENRRKVKQLEKNNSSTQEELVKTQAYAEALETELKAIEKSLADLQSNQQRLNSESSEDLPVGFGFDGTVRTKPMNVTTGQWVMPLDKVIDEKDKKGSFSTLFQKPALTPTQSNKNTNKAKKKTETVKPYYTLPKDLILTDALAITALIGRIPVQGTTPDPYPAKFFIGAENLAANGHEIPEVDGMIFSGLVFGDFNLKCVTVRLYSASYIFNDGRIVNHSQNGDVPLGYVSDPYGWPCISGEFISNAPTFLAQRFGLAGLSAAGAAYANAQFESRSSDLTGNTTRSLTGDIDKLVAGTVVQSAVDEAVDWLEARQKDSFDAFVVDPGESVAIHLDLPLHIDYDEQARRTHYATTATKTINTLD